MISSLALLDATHEEPRRRARKVDHRRRWVLGDLGNELRRRAAVTDDANALASERNVVPPERRVELVALEIAETLERGRLVIRHREAANRRDEDLRLDTESLRLIGLAREGDLVNVLGRDPLGGDEARVVLRVRA